MDGVIIIVAAFEEQLYSGAFLKDSLANIYVRVVSVRCLLEALRK